LSGQRIHSDANLKIVTSLSFSWKFAFTRYTNSQHPGLADDFDIFKGYVKQKTLTSDANAPLMPRLVHENLTKLLVVKRVN
jgi:hypothetical protein